jgi:hypothetical protein
MNAAAHKTSEESATVGRRGNKAVAWHGCAYNAILILCSLTTQAQAAVFSFNAQFTNGNVLEQRPFRLWLPDANETTPGTTAPVWGVVFILPGSGEDWRNHVENENLQKAAHSLGFGLIAAQSMIWGYEDDEISGVVQSVLNAAAAVSNRPELVNAPYASVGVSQGGYNASRIALADPNRAIAFVNIRGVYGHAVPALGSATLAVPGLSIVASKDDIVPPQATYADWTAWRNVQAPHALMVDWNTTHYDTRNGQSWETAWHWIGEAARLRYFSTAPLSATPGQLPVLKPLDYAEGWLTQTPQLLPGSNPPVSIPPQEVEIASIASGTFSGPPATNSWVPTQGAAMVYRAFGSVDGISRPPSALRPRQSPLYILLDPVHDTDNYDTPLFQTGETVFITAEMSIRDQIINGIYINSVDFYLDGQLLDTDISTGGSGPFQDYQWTVGVPLTSPGIHALVAVGHTASGRRYSTFRTVLVVASVPETTSLATAVVGAILLCLHSRRSTH